MSKRPAPGRPAPIEHDALQRPPLERVLDDDRDDAGPPPTFSLRDRDTAEDGQILATGIQALVRLPIDLMRCRPAQRAGTAAFISGYQGSPLGGYDRELAQAEMLRDAQHRARTGAQRGARGDIGVRFAAAQTYDRPKFEGVAGIWYGKSPGLDRAGDAIRHGSFGGTGRVAACCWSATMRRPSRRRSRRAESRSSASTCRRVPRHGAGRARSRSPRVRNVAGIGLWVAMKITTPVADGSGMAEVAPGRFGRPADLRGRRWRRTPTLTRARCSVRPHVERSSPHRVGQALCRREPDQPMLVDPPTPGWASSPGHMQQVMQALRVLGLDAASCASSVCVCSSSAPCTRSTRALRATRQRDGDGDGGRGQARLPRDHGSAPCCTARPTHRPSSARSTTTASR